METVDDLLREAKDNVVGDTKPIPYYASWKGFDSSGISYVNGNLCINNFCKNGKARYILEEKEIEELKNFITIVLENIIERGGVLKSDYEMVYDKLEEIVGDDKIVKTARGCPGCGSILVYRDGKIDTYKKNFDKNVDKVKEHSCSYSEKGEYLDGSQVLILEIKEIYPNKSYIKPPNTIYDPTEE